MFAINKLQLQYFYNMNPEVTQYINNAPPAQKEIMEAIRTLLHNTIPQATEEFKWSRPVFRTHKDFAYLKTAKAYVTLGFFQFQKLEDASNRLEGTGKDMRHIKLKTVKDIDHALLQNWFTIAAQ